MPDIALIKYEGSQHKAHCLFLYNPIKKHGIPEVVHDVALELGISVECPNGAMNDCHLCKSLKM